MMIVDVWAQITTERMAKRKANLAVLQKISTSWEQGDYLQKGGWATQPGATSSDYHLARACAEKLVQAKTAAQ
jgi:hypothetical protein